MFRLACWLLTYEMPTFTSQGVRHFVRSHVTACLSLCEAVNGRLLSRQK